MKLTETKLKQMILEMMSQSEDYYNKLKTLLTTEEGYLQADSLFEVVKDQLDAKHRMYMLRLLKPLHLGRELGQAIQATKESYARYKEAHEAEFEYPNQMFDDQIGQFEKAYDEYQSALSAERSLSAKLNSELNTMRKAGVDPEIIRVANKVSMKAMRGEYI